MFCHLSTFPYVASFPEYSLWPNKLGLLTYTLNPGKKPLCISCRAGNVLEKATTEILDLSHRLSSLNSQALPPTYQHWVAVIEECFLLCSFFCRQVSNLPHCACAAGGGHQPSSHVLREGALLGWQAAFGALLLLRRSRGLPNSSLAIHPQLVRTGSDTESDT